MRRVVTGLLTVSTLVVAGCMSTASWRERDLEKTYNLDWVKSEPGGHWNVTSFTYVDNTKGSDYAYAPLAEMENLEQDLDRASGNAHTKHKRAKKSAEVEAAKKAQDVKQRENDILGWAKNYSDYRLMFVDDDEHPSIPVSIKITVEDGRPISMGAFAIINNILGFCSLTAWPVVWTEEKFYTIEAQFPHGTLERKIIIDNRQMLSLLPLGLIPVPAWAEKHSRESGMKPNIDNARREYENLVLRDQLLKFLNLGQYNREVDALKTNK